eukprot:scaffold10155_cov117-Isochrysis_galbana.AAC.3
MKSANVIPPQMVQRSHRATAKASLGVRARMYFWNTFRAGSRGSACRSFSIMSARMSLGRSSYVVTRRCGGGILQQNN